MEEKKLTINLSTIIIIIVIAVAVIIGVIYYISNKEQKEVSNLYKNYLYEEAQKVENNNNSNHNNENDEKEVQNSEIPQQSNNESEIENENSNYNEIDENNNISSTNNNTTKAKTSSKEYPLNVGEWGIASKYVSGKYVDVPAKVTNITRGSSAAQELENYLTNSSSIYKYEDAKYGMEWAVIEYSIDLTQMENDSTAKLDTKITGTGDNTSIKYNDTIYIISTINMTPNNYTKGEIETCKFAVQLPIGCTDYLVALGSSSGTQAFFYGK